MGSVKKDLKDKMDTIDKTDKGKKKNNDVETITVEREFFREEAIKLNELCKELDLANHNLRKENNIKKNEIIQINKKWSESENINKQLFIELENNLKIIKKLEDEKTELTNFYNNNIYNFYNNLGQNNSSWNNQTLIPNISYLHNSSENNNKNNISTNIEIYEKNSDNIILKENIINMEKMKNVNNSSGFNGLNLNNTSCYNLQHRSTEDYSSVINNNKMNTFNSSIIDYSTTDKKKILNIIENLKMELKKEKNRNQKIITEFNKILLDKRDVVKIFNECLDETRKEIMQRKFRDTFNSTKNTFFKSFAKNSGDYLPVINDIKFENFKSIDKRKLLEEFLMNDEIINFIRDNLGKLNIENKAPFFQNNSLHDQILNIRKKTVINESGNSVLKSDLSKTKSILDLNYNRKKIKINK